VFVVCGVTGRTGAVVAEGLLAAGKQVRVVVRDASRGEPWKAKGAVVAEASFDDREALERALRGATGGYFLLPPNTTARDALAEARATTDAIAQAVEGAGLLHGVLLSSMAAHLAAGTGIIRALHHAERRLAETPARWTFVRAGYFVENFGAQLAAAAQGTLPSFIRPGLGIPMVASRDVGLTVLRALLSGPPAAHVEVIELSGPREHSAEDVARALAGLLEREVTALAAPEEAVVPTFTGMGVSPDVAELYREMFHGMNEGTVVFEGGGARALRGELDLEGVLAGMLGGR
jgi:uncharacterized protein YbjT (DUF2867 family)